MTSKFVLLGTFAIGLLSIVVGLMFYLGPKPERPSVTKANFDRIQVGMSQADVEKIFGRSNDGLQAGKPNRPVWLEGGGPGGAIVTLDKNNQLDGLASHPSQTDFVSGGSIGSNP